MTSFSIAGWLQGIKNHSSGSSTRRTQRRLGSSHRKATAQQLESRYVLSAFTVNTTLDTVDANPGDGLALDSNGNTSLRAAVMEANAGAGADTITLPAGVYQLTISPTTGSAAAVDGDLDLAANSGISIVGAGRDLTIIDGGGLDRLFEVPTTSSLQLDAVTLRNGLADTGGAISSGGDLRITDSRLTGNRGRFRGGAIDTTAGQLSIQQSKLDLNLASDSANPTAPSGNGLGGGVAAFATSISVNGSEFLGNRSAGEGGAFSIQSSTSFLVQSSTFSGNFSQNGGSLRLVNSSGTLTGNLYQNERATTQGGAIYSSNSSIGLFRNVFDNVRLTNGFRGGVIYVNSFSNTVQIINSEFKNSGSATGGGIYHTSGTIEIRQTLFDTVSGGQGGALFNANGATATIINTTFFGGTGSLGGAIYNEGTINMSHTTISGNTSVGLTAPGGAVFNASTGTLTIGNSIIAANVANRDVVGTIASLGGNVIGAAPATAFTNATDKKGTTTAPLDPQLLPLALNQWFVRTMAIRPTSPARDAGQLLTLPLGWPTDARQIDRSGLRPDAGAYEYQNQAPSISNYSATFDEDQVFVGQLPGTDPDGDTLTYTLTSPPPPGQFSLSPNGSFTYTPPANANGLVFFGFKATDGIVTTTAALAALTISPINDAPVFNDQSFSIEENSPAGTLIGFFQTTDIDSTSLTYSIISGNEDDGFAFSPFGAIGVAKPEAFNFATNPVRTLVVQVTDNGSPALSDTAIITVNVTSSNRAPDAQDDSASMFEDDTIAIPVLANDSDPDGNTITITSLTQPGHGTATINTDGTIQYVPAANFNGTDSLTYTISDPLGRTDIATVTITVAPVNDFPVGVEDFVVVDEDGSATFDVIANDTDVDGDILSFVRVVAFSHGTVVVNSNGTLTYTPDANYNGAADISYLLSDPSGYQSGGHVAITVNSVNDAPVGSNDSAVVDEDNSVVINVLANDSDVDGDTLSVSSIGLIDHGTVVINSDNTLTYTPPTNYFGPATFSYFMKDPSGAIGSAVVTLTVNSVNDIPVAVEDFVTTDEDNTVTFSPVDNDTDADGDILRVLAVGRADHGTTTVNADGTVSYVPQPNFFGTDAFFYLASDGNGGDTFGTIRVTVQSVNDTPVANNDSATLFEDGYAIIYVLGNDSDIDGDVLSIQSVSLIDHGSVTINADRSLTYTPPANYNGQAHFTYFVQDPSGAVSSAVVTLTVVPVNDFPVIVDDTVTTNEDTPITISPLANDSDIDGDTLTVISVSNGDHGTASINPDGTVKYVPEPNFFGTDAFFYLASDGNGGDTFGTIRVTVQSVNDAPVGTNDSAVLDEDSSVTINVLANDSDVDGDILSIHSVVLIDRGSVRINANNTLTYTPPANYNGPARFTYLMKDPLGLVGSAVVTLTIRPVNDAPVANAGPDKTSSEGASVSFSGALSRDVDGDALTYSWTFGDGQTGSGIAPSHVYADNGVYTVTLKVTDPSGSFSTDTLLVTVSNVAPVATLTGAASGVRGQARTFVVSASDVSSVDQNAQFTFRVTWGDGTSNVVSGGSAGVSLEHVYTSAGTFTVRATTVDKDGAESSAKTQSIVIRVVELQSGVLAIGGATTSDAISLEPTNTSGAVSVVVNGTSYGSFTAVSEILIFGQAGNDDIRLQSKKFSSTTARIGVPTTVFGDDGNDVIDVSATTGNNILLGGSGSDSLFGGTGRDILIGGLGADLLYGGDGDDLLIAGYTTYDASLTSLNAIRSEWTSGRTYATRIANLRGTGTGVRNNGSTFLSSSSVLNDTNIDRLFGESGLDWFWGKVNQDLFQDRSSSLEALN